MTNVSDRLMQKEWEEKFSRKNLYKIIRKEVLHDLDASMFNQYLHCVDRISEYRKQKYFKSKDLRIEALPDTDSCVLELMIAVLKLTGVSPIQNIAAQLGMALGYLDPFDGVKTASEIIAICRKANLYKLIYPKDSDTGSLMIESLFELDPETITQINLHQYLPPMIIKPEWLRLNKQSPYLTFNQSILLGKGNHHNETQGLDVLNVMSRVALELDTEMLKHTERPNKPLDTPDKIAQFSQFKSESEVMYSMLLNKHFYLTKAFDKRGRIYDRGYHIAFQSTSYKKSLINLVKKEVIK